MRTVDAINMYNTLGRLKLSAIKDKAAMTALMDNHLALWRVSREFDEFMESLRDKPEEINLARRHYLWKELSIDLTKVGRESVIEAAVESGMTLADMTVLGELFKNED